MKILIKFILILFHTFLGLAKWQKKAKIINLLGITSMTLKCNSSVIQEKNLKEMLKVWLNFPE